MKKILAMAIITVTMISSAPMMAFCEEPSAVVDNDCYEIAELINTQRVNNGLDSYTWNDSLETSALVRAEELSVSFSSTRPDGQAWWTIGNTERSSGENVSHGSSTVCIPEKVVASFGKDSTQFANIVSQKFTNIAVAKYKVSDDEVYYAIEFN